MKDIRSFTCPYGWENEKINAAVSYAEGDVLDLGCGWGVIAQALVEKGCVVTGVDLQSYNIPGIKFHEQDVLEFLWGNKIQYDTIVLLDVLDCVAYPHIVFQEVLRHLKTGGVFLFSVHNGYSLSRLWKRQKNLHTFNHKSFSKDCCLIGNGGVFGLGKVGRVLSRYVPKWMLCSWIYRYEDKSLQDADFLDEDERGGDR